VNRRKNNNRC